MKKRVTQGKPDLARLGRMVKERREALGLTQVEVNALGGPSDSTFTKIVNLEWQPGRAVTLRKLDAGLKWQPGSSARILYDGGDPIPLNDATVQADAEEAREVSELTDLAMQVLLLMESGLLEAATYLAERLALRLAGSDEEFARRHMELRARIRTRLGHPAPPPERGEIQYLADGSLDPDEVRLSPEPDPANVADAAEIERRFSSDDPTPDVG